MSDIGSPADRGTEGGRSPYFSPTTRTSPPAAVTAFTTPHASPATSRARYSRLFPHLTPSALSPTGSTNVNLPSPLSVGPSAASTAGGAGSASAGTSPRANSAVEAMGTTLKGRTRLHTATTAIGSSTSAWVPTRLTSPYCVLSAAGLQEDFYTSCLSWGTHQMALALQEDLVLFHPSHPRHASSTARISAAPDGPAATAFIASRRATAVAMARFHLSSCFLGMSNGAVELYEGRGDGTLQCTRAFAVPTPPTDYLASLLRTSTSLRTGAAEAQSTDPAGGVTESTAPSRAARALSLLSASVSAISSIGTSPRHPWLAAVATAARGCVMVDARQPDPPLRFGVDEADAPDSVDGISKNTCRNAQGGSRLHQLRSAAAFLQQQDRLCSVTWNATGSLVATGSGSGVVRVWSLSAPHRPLHHFQVDPDCSVKALAFHPTNPYALLVGASAGPSGLRTYGLAGATPTLVATGATAAAVTQALWDPDGHFAVTAAGVPAAVRGTAVSERGRGSSRLSPLRRGAGGGRSPLWHLSSPTRTASALSGGGGVPWGEEASEGFDFDADVRHPLELDGTISGGSPLREGSDGSAAHASPTNALVVWRCGSRHRESYLRDALLYNNNNNGGEQRSEDRQRRGESLFGAASLSDSDEEEAIEEEEEVDGSEQRRPQRRSRCRPSTSTTAAARSAVGTADDDESRSAWVPMTSLPGHRARPLLLCAPFPQSPFAGCYASIAGGDDGTIRFWRLFETTSDAVHLRHRRRAQQQSATTQADMDVFTTPVLR